jgi:hypothetical protein
MNILDLCVEDGDITIRECDLPHWPAPGLDDTRLS